MVGGVGSGAEIVGDKEIALAGVIGCDWEAGFVALDELVVGKALVGLMSLLHWF